MNTIYVVEFYISFFLWHMNIKEATTLYHLCYNLAVKSCLKDAKYRFVTLTNNLQHICFSFFEKQDTLKVTDVGF